MGFDLKNARAVGWGKVLATLVGVMLFVGGVGQAEAHIRELEPSTAPIHVRVLFIKQPQHQAVVSWTTTAEGESHELYVDTEPREGDLDAYEQRFASDHSQAYSLRDEEREAGMDAWTHNVHLQDLEPATAYYLTVVSDGDASEEFWFRTAPDDDRDIKLLAVGDSRTPGGGRTDPDNTRRQVNATMRRLFEEHPEVVAMSHGGDYTNRAYWGEVYWWLKDHAEKTTTADNRLLPIIPVQGNHDTHGAFEEMFWWPGMNDADRHYYYITQLSDEVTIVTLNTEISMGGDQAGWLEQHLPGLRSENRWVMAQYHRPAYPSVRGYGGASGVREAWVGHFERYRIDLAYESHDHALKRTYPIHDGEIDAERGIVYFGDGGGGVSQRNPDGDRWYLEMVDRQHHTHLLSFGEDTVDIQAVNIDDEIVDTFELTWDRRAEHAEASN